ncbi:MAG TPA: DinB family protein [Terriglobales bacterium]|nr:DinB family protein [Terriglobales bacterium]
MGEAKRIAELYRSVYEGDNNGEAWHGLALKPLLKSVTAEQAARVPSTGAHSILQLVLHIAYWEEVVLRRLQGEVVDAALNTLDDWPSNRKLTSAEWQAALSRLEKSHLALRQAIESVTDDKLKQMVPKRDHDNYTLLHGIIHHCVYHGGQIALVKKLTS